MIYIKRLIGSVQHRETLRHREQLWVNDSRKKLKSLFFGRGRSHCPLPNRVAAWNVFVLRRRRLQNRSVSSDPRWLKICERETPGEARKSNINSFWGRPRCVRGFTYKTLHVPKVGVECLVTAVSLAYLFLVNVLVWLLVFNNDGFVVFRLQTEMLGLKATHGLHQFSPGLSRFYTNIYNY